MTLPLPTLDYPYIIRDVADEGPIHVYVRCSVPTVFGYPTFQGVLADADKHETERSPVCASRTSMVTWLVSNGVRHDRAAWMVENVLSYAREHSSDGAADLQ